MTQKSSVCSHVFYLLPGLINLLEPLVELPLDVAGSLLRATNATTPLLIEVSQHP